MPRFNEFYLNPNQSYLFAEIRPSRATALRRLRVPARREIAVHDFGSRRVKIAVDEVFVSDGGKSDCANLQEIFARDCVVALMDPVHRSTPTVR